MDGSVVKMLVLANTTYFVYAAPKSMTIAVFSPPLTKPSNKGIVPNFSEKSSIFSADNSKFASYERDGKKSVVFRWGWVGALEAR